MRKVVLLVFVLLTSFTGFSQDFSNKGKDFWVGYGYHEQMTNGGGGGSQTMVLYFATDQVTNITITVPGTGYSQSITTGAGNNVITSAAIPKTGPQDARLTVEGLTNRGIHIVSDKPMVAYAHIYNASVSGATILYPTNTLGREYYSVNYKNWSNTTNANCWFYVVAADTGTTTIEITPSGGTTGGWIAGTTHTVTLTQGQVYNVMGLLLSSPANCNPVCTGVDLTGSKIKSVNNGSGCKKIAVFSGSGRISITCNNSNSSSDNYMVQAMPKTAWGKKYLTTQALGLIDATHPLGNQAYNFYRVCVSDPATIVKINGSVTALPLQNNFYYDVPITNQPQMIEGDSAIMVAQYFTSQGACNNGNPGDPEVIYLSAVEQNINTVLWNATQYNAILNHYFNVVIPNSGTALSSFTLDGAPLGGFTVDPLDPNYSYLRFRLTGGPFNDGRGFHIIHSDSGFNAIAYGFGNAESYGYNAGTNIKDLYQQIGVHTQYGIETSPSVCTGAPFKFKVSLPYIPDSMYWNFHNAASMLPNNTNVMINNTGNMAEDSATVVNGKTIHWYSVPLTYNFTAVGVYPVTITTYVPNADCGSVQDIDFDLTVSAPPVADFLWQNSGCVAEPVQFEETTPQFPKPTYSFYWNFGDPASGGSNTSTLRNPVHAFSAPGTYTVKYVAITTPGCFTDTIVHQVIVNPLPNATISGTTSLCINSTQPLITFTGSDGTAPYTFTYTINGGAPLTVNSPGVTTTATVSVPTNVVGPFVYTLVSVKNVGSTLCTQNVTGQSATVTINPSPTAAIAGSTTVCLNATPPPVTFTGNGGTAPYTFTYTINGTPQAPVVSNGAGVYIINAPTNVAGPFTYTITSVTDASSSLCSATTNVSTTITVNDLPNAAISGATSVCLNAAQPLVTFTGSGGTAPYTFTYTINGVAQPPLVSNAAGVGTVNAPTNVVGPFMYALVSVLEGGTTACIRNNLTGTTLITVNPIPTAAIAGSITVCLNATPPPVTFTGSGGTAPYTFAYTINGTPQAPVVSNGAGIYIINAPTNVAGPFTYTITSVTDASSTLCSSTPNVSTTINVNDLPNAAISGATSVCLNATQPVVTFTGSGGTAPYTFNYTINGVAQPPLVSNAAGVGTVNAPTNVAGPFNYALVSVQEGGATACIRNNLTGTTLITVNPLPSATISGTTEVCLNAPSPFITLTGTGSIAPYTFNYTINGVPQTPIISNAAGVATINVLTNVANTFVFVLVNVRDASSTLCLQTISGQQATVIVDPLPTANFNFTTPSCETRTINFTDASVPNVGTLTNWQWNFGDPASGGNNTSTLQNPSHTFAVSGSYVVSLIVTSSKGCSNLSFTRTVVINNRPQAGFMIPEVCINDIAAIFTDTSKILAPDSFDPAGYVWDFGDGSPRTFTQNGTHLYTATGVYNVMHIVTSSFGCRDTITQPITINGANPLAIFAVNNPATLCANDSVAITNQSNVNFGNVTKVEIWWDNVGFPGVSQVDDFPFFGKVYRHLYPNFQTPLTKNFTVKFRAYSGTLCFNDVTQVITVNAAPRVQFNAMPNTCLLVPPFQITQASEIGGVPGTGVFSGPGVSPTGLFTPTVAGIGTHRILYTFTSSAGGCVDTMSNTITVLDTAHAFFTHSSPICQTVAGSFTDASTAPASVTLSNTVWNFGDGSPIENHAPGSTFTHLFPGPGTYVVTMHNVSTVGCNSTNYSQSVTVDPDHTISLNPGSLNTQTVCINTLIAPIVYTLGGGATGATVTGLPAGVTYTVTGTTLTILGAPSTAILSPFNYSIVTTGNGCLVAQATGRITVDPDHTIALVPGGDTSQAICFNSTITPIKYTLGGGATGATVTGLPSGVTYTVVGNTLTISGTPVVTVPYVFNYSILTSGNGCIKANTTGSIRVNPFPVPNFAIDKPSYCIPNAIVGFINGSTMPNGDGMVYSWNFGDGSPLSTAANPLHQYISQGPFNVRLTVTSSPLFGAGCVHDTVIVVNNIHPQPKANFSFNKPSVCIGDDITLTDLSDGKDGTINQWHWDMGDGVIKTTNTVTYTYTDTITYNIKLYTINTQNCNSDTLTKQFTVYPYPHVNAGPDRSILEGGQITLAPVVYGNDLQFLWTPNQYLIDNRVENVKVNKPLTDMTYRLTVTARGGCSLSDDVFVKLLKFPIIPNTFTPNNDGINDTWRIDYLNTYPNNVVQVFTRTGQLVFESRGYNTPWDGTLKGKPLPFDTYYYIIEPGNGREPITGYVTILK